MGGRGWDGFGYFVFIGDTNGFSGGVLALLDLAVRRGWFPDGRAAALDLADEPAFRSLRGEPRFEALRKRLLDHIAREQAELGPLKV
jgi:hypothetical protein